MNDEQNQRTNGITIETSSTAAATAITNTNSPHQATMRKLRVFDTYANN